MSSKKELYLCELCTKKVNDNYRVICPFCSVEIDFFAPAARLSVFLAKTPTLAL